MERKAARPVLYENGFSESLWKSLLVKSIRLGWPNGIIEAEKHLKPSVVQGIAICQIFEDIWPLEEEIPEILEQITSRNWVELCKWDTHHGMGISGDYAKYEKDAVEMSKTRQGEIYELARRLKVWLTPRAIPEFALWRLSYTDIKNPKPKREIDTEPWRGMPADCADMHTYEGRKLKTFETILSGNTGGHIRLKREVQESGWKLARILIHQNGILAPDPNHIEDQLPKAESKAKPKQVIKQAQMTLALFG